MERKYFKPVIFGTAILAIVLLYFFFDARKGYDLLPRCPLYSLTGFYCPGCGSQRAVSALLHGSITGAAKMNILMVLYLPFIVYSAAIGLFNLFRKKPLQQRIFYSPLFVRITLCLVLLFFVLRNIPVYPFNLLAPHS